MTYRPYFPGCLVAIQVLGSGTTLTKNARTHAMSLEMVGAGGGGGGASSAAASAAVGSGGGGGSYGWAEVDTVADPGPYTYAIGGGGSAGSTAGGDGGDGGDTTIVVDGTTYKAAGGHNGVGQTANTTDVFVAAGAGGGFSNNLEFAPSGQPGCNSHRISGTHIDPATGGASAFGAGGYTFPGLTDAFGRGSGGAGGVVSNNSGASAGGIGGDGLIVAWEYT